MATEVVAVIVATISAVLSLATAATLEVSRRRSASRLEQMKHELALDRERDTQQRTTAELLLAYRNPTLRSAFDLQSRIYNLHRGFRGSRDPEYFTLNTLFLMAEFFGWLEIIRREQQFLDSAVDPDSFKVKVAIDRVQDAFAATWRQQRDAVFLYRGQQRAIGELMIVEHADPLARGPRSRCIGYAEFVRRFEDPSFSRWFDRVGAQLADLSVDDLNRLVRVQHALVDLVDLLDPDHVRFPAERGKIDASVEPGG